MTEMERDQTRFQWIHTPELRDPYLIMGFRGWSDAGGVSSDTLQYLAGMLQTRPVAVLSDDCFINYSVDRPSARIENGSIDYLDPMCTELTCWINDVGSRDVLFMLGREPHYNWFRYTRIVQDMMSRLRVKRLYIIGGLHDTISHSSPALVSFTGSSSEIIAGTLQLDTGIRPSEYHGPVSIHAYLMKSCTESGIEAVSLWGHVPAYLQKSPRLIAKITTILNKVVGMDCPLEILKQKSIELDRKIDEALAKDPSLKDLVETLESRDRLEDSPTDDEKVIRLNQFLRRDSKKEPEA